MSASQTAMATAVATAHATFREHNPVSAEVHAKAAEHMPGGNTRTVLYAEPFPVAIASADGNTLTSADGRTYVDFLGEFSAGLFGHSHPKIAAALETAMRGGWNYGGESLCEKTLAARVTERFAAGGLDLVRFTNSGTEANTFAIGAALTFTGRQSILVFSSGYHGGTFIFPMNLCRWMHAGGKATGTEPPCHTMNLPHDFVAAPWNNVAETAAIVDRLPPNSLAAVLVEPIQGSGGCRPASPAFLRYLRQTCDRLGALLIADEVMSSRLGPSGSLATHEYGLRADLLSFGKWIGGGMTFGAFGGRRDVMALFDPSLGPERRLMHPGTYNNNVFTMYAGIAGLELYDAAAVAALNARGDRLKTGITKALFASGAYPHADDPAARHLHDVLEVDSFAGQTRLYAGEDQPTLPLPKVFLASRGSMLNLRFSGPSAGLWHNLYYHFMLEQGIYMASRGYTPLNLVITDDNVDSFIVAVAAFLDKHKAELAA
ncbi:aminotransferase class 3 [Grosmannia clavigera kw1407]|uniref:Aminotransferase class 3 n=1 Tax=Grosmannia clavigera (strain kw1407 / UAMH 11150) TaxID=655863 RepID=F0XUL0_GROCL|nr:aminotransferase class 3 [Grosmannia clavigera kw1407]EFW99062.1 aminotransferase class 3 [Grosmannia clavigera kw1407]